MQIAPQSPSIPFKGSELHRTTNGEITRYTPVLEFNDSHQMQLFESSSLMNPKNLKMLVEDEYNKTAVFKPQEDVAFQVEWWKPSNMISCVLKYNPGQKNEREVLYQFDNDKLGAEKTKSIIEKIKSYVLPDN